MGYPDIPGAAKGRWKFILTTIGVESKWLDGNHHPCPICGGHDRFRFQDKDGSGNWFCTHCNGGKTGFSLVEKLLGLEDWKAARQKVADVLGIENKPDAVQKEKTYDADSTKRMNEALRKAWTNADAIKKTDPAWKYLIKTRGLRGYESKALAYHKGMCYKDADKVNRGYFPCMLARVVDPQGNSVTIHRTFLTPEGKKIDRVLGEAKKLMPTPRSLRGCAIRLAEPVNGVLGIAEGIETGMFCMLETKIPVWCSISSALMKTLVVPPDVHTVYIFADNDADKQGLKAAQVLAERLAKDGVKVYIILPPIVGKDWLDIGKVSIDEHKETKFEVEDAWPKPMMVDEKIEAPKFDISVIPDPYLDYCMDVAEAIQCPIEFPFIGVMTAASIVLGASCEMRPKTRSNWPVTPNLWGLVIGDPGTRKSPAITAAQSILAKLQTSTREIWKQESKLYAREKKMYDIKAKAIEDKLRMAHGLKKDKYDAAVIQDELDALGDEPEVPTWKRFYTNDSTVEKLIKLLAENHRGMLITADEIARLLKTWEREGRQADRQFIMEGWNGNAPYVNDRVSSGTGDIPYLCLSLLGTIQPKVLRRELASSIMSTEDGLFQRFQLMVYPKCDPLRWSNEPEDRLAKGIVVDTFRTIALSDPRELGAILDPDDRRPHFRFTEEAAEVFKYWFLSNDTKMRALPSDQSAMKAHLSKFNSLVPSLALIIHLADSVAHKSFGPVTLTALEKALRLTTILEGHARKVYALVSGYKKAARVELQDHIKAGHLGASFTPRDIQRKDWRGLTDKKEVDELLEILSDMNWIRLEEVAEDGRVHKKWVINPWLKKEKYRG